MIFTATETTTGILKNVSVIEADITTAVAADSSLTKNTHSSIPLWVMPNKAKFNSTDSTWSNADVPLLVADLNSRIQAAWIIQEKAFGSKQDWYYRSIWESGRANLAIFDMPATTATNYNHERRARNTWFWRIALAWRAKGLATLEALQLFESLEGVEQEVWYRAHVVATWWALIATVNSQAPSFLPYTTNLTTGGFAAVYPSPVDGTFTPWNMAA